MQNTDINKPCGVTPVFKAKTTLYEYFSKPEEHYFSADTMKVMQSIYELNKNTLSIPEKSHRNGATLDEQLFDARANVKLLFSQVSMHFSDALREKLFRQIDLLHDPVDWEEGESPIQAQSFKTFLRWFYLNKPLAIPNFGLSSNGHFIATWLSNQNKDRLILEFLSNDQIKWFVSKYYDEQAEHAAGLTPLNRVKDVLSPYSINDWFLK